MDEVSVDSVAELVASLLELIDKDDIREHSGKQLCGWTDPCEAALEVARESIADIQADMNRRFEAGMISPAEKICQGIILALYDLEGASHVDVLEMAPDFPPRFAAANLSTLLNLYPKSQRNAAGQRIISCVADDSNGWFEMLTKVVDEASIAENT